MESTVTPLCRDHYKPKQGLAIKSMLGIPWYRLRIPHAAAKGYEHK